jgi:Uma2 family endonuclease
VEIKSPDDTFDDIVDRCFDYEKLTVRNILVMDPDNQRAWLFQQGNLQLLTGATIRLKEPAIDFPFAQLFTEIDDDNR